MDALWQPELLAAIATTLMAGIVRGFAGFGGAIVQAPIFAVLYSPLQAVALISSLGLLASLQLVPSALAHAHRRELVPLFLAVVVCVPLGGLILATADPGIMRRVISGIVLLLVAALASGLRYPGRPSFWSSVGVGAVSGTLNGATGVGGPPVILYFLAGPNPAGVNRANLIVYYAVLNAGTAVMLAWRGAFTRDLLWHTLILWPVQIAGLWLGAWGFRRANDAIYRRLALALMLAVGLFGLLYRK
jgi:uncharacterized membrane protein YfcA